MRIYYGPGSFRKNSIGCISVFVALFGLILIIVFVASLGAAIFPESGIKSFTEALNKRKPGVHVVLGFFFVLAFAISVLGGDAVREWLERKWPE